MTYPFLPVFTDFWSFDAGSTDPAAFNAWHAGAVVPNISPEIGADGAYFRMAYDDRQSLYMKGNGELVATRHPGDLDNHTMIEVSVNGQAGAHQFVQHGGYRFMAVGVPYEIELEVKIEDGAWIATTPWTLIFQGVAFPDTHDEGKTYNPPFTLEIKEGNWRLALRGDSRASLPQPAAYERQDFIVLGPVVPDVWTRFVIRAVWGFEDAGGTYPGELGVWQDGRLVHQERGKKNFYNNVTPQGDYMGPHLHLGLYSGDPDMQATARFRKLKIGVGS